MYICYDDLHTITKQAIYTYRHWQYCNKIVCDQCGVSCRYCNMRRAIQVLPARCVIGWLACAPPPGGEWRGSTCGGLRIWPSLTPSRRSRFCCTTRARHTSNGDRVANIPVRVLASLVMRSVLSLCHGIRRISALPCCSLDLFDEYGLPWLECWLSIDECIRGALGMVC